MDDLLGTLFYILISIALIVFSALKKNKKQGSRINTPQKDDASASSEKVPANSFWEELLGIEDENAQQMAASAEPQEEATNIEENAPVTNTKQEPVNKTALTTKTDETTAWGTQPDRKQKPDNLNIAAELRRKRELQKAILYSEIIKPKHF